MNNKLKDELLKNFFKIEIKDNKVCLGRHILNEEEIQYVWDNTAIYVETRIKIYPFIKDKIKLNTNPIEKQKLYLFEITCPVCKNKYKEIETIDEISPYNTCPICSTNYYDNDIEEYSVLRSIDIPLE